MFERFTERSREVVTQAQTQARSFGHDRIGTHHLLLAMLDVEQSLAAQVLTRFRVTQPKIEETWDESAEPQVVAAPKEDDGRLPFTLPAQKMLELSLREALSLGHNYIGTEHILLAGVRVEGESARVLATLGVMPNELREEVMRVLSGPAARRRTMPAEPKDEPHVVRLSRDQLWAIYDLTVAKAIAIETNEDAAQAGLGSGRYRAAANAIKEALGA